MKDFAKVNGLETIFRAGVMPDPETLLGPNCQPSEWRVTMLTGIIAFIYTFVGWLLGHRKEIKLIRTVPEHVGGCNLFFGNFRWGGFQTVPDIYSSKDDGYDGARDAGDGKPVLHIDYEVPENSFLTRRIRDHVRTTNSPDVLIGRFSYRLLGHYCFLGYFLLTRIGSR